MSSEEAVAQLVVNSGTQFDPKVVHALTAVVARGEPVAPKATDGVRAVLAGAAVPQSAAS